MTNAPLHTDQDTLPGLLSYIAEAVAILWKDWPKDMIITALDTKDNFSLSGKCPHCNRDSVFVRVSNPYRDTLPGSLLLLAAVMQCQGCRELILGMATHPDGSHPSYWYKTHYPLGRPNDEVAPEIPEAIKADFKEALRCLWVDAYNATAEMCRRAVETSCINLGAPKSERWLEDKIDWLESQRKITPFLRDVAHKIRLGGNRAAHPGNVQPSTVPGTPHISDPEPPITKEHAEAIVKFTTEFFHHVYVVPKQLEKYDFSKPKQTTALATETSVLPTPIKPAEGN